MSQSVSATLGCPICDLPVGPTDPSCPGCGYPRALQAEARRALSDFETPPPSSRDDRAAPSTRRPSPAPSHARDRTFEACTEAAEALETQLQLLRRIGGSALVYSGALRQAALVQAEGKLAESLELLTASREEAERALTELLDERCNELQSRVEALEKDRIQADIADRLARLRAAVGAHEVDAASALIAEMDRSLGGLERSWRDLQSLLFQIDELGAAAKDAGQPVPDVEETLGELRTILGEPRIAPEMVDHASQLAAQTLVALHEAIPKVLERDLDRLGMALSPYPFDHEPSRRAKVLHSEVTRHLRRARLGDAAKGLAELRREIRRLEASSDVAAAAPELPEPTSPAPVAGEDALPQLLAKARQLASRIRALAPDSEIAYEAAGEIRRATELLKARRLEEADAALTHLMRTLESAPPEER